MHCQLQGVRGPLWNLSYIFPDSSLREVTSAPFQGVWGHPVSVACFGSTSEWPKAATFLVKAPCHWGQQETAFDSNCSRLAGGIPSCSHLQTPFLTSKKDKEQQNTLKTACEIEIVPQ